MQISFGRRVCCSPAGGSATCSQPWLLLVIWSLLIGYHLYKPYLPILFKLLLIEFTLSHVVQNPCKILKILVKKFFFSRVFFIQKKKKKPTRYKKVFQPHTGGVEVGASVCSSSPSPPAYMVLAAIRGVE